MNALREHNQESLDGSEQAAASGRGLSRIALMVLLAGMLISIAAVGCTETQSRVIPVDPSNFNSIVLNSKQPVLINFYKDG
jgi:hypothetical protein